MAHSPSGHLLVIHTGKKGLYNKQAHFSVLRANPKIGDQKRLTNWWGSFRSGYWVRSRFCIYVRVKVQMWTYLWTGEWWHDCDKVVTKLWPVYVTTLVIQVLQHSILGCFCVYQMEGVLLFTERLSGCYWLVSGCFLILMDSYTRSPLKKISVDQSTSIGVTLCESK